jgi:hypothetical protein
VNAIRNLDFGRAKRVFAPLALSALLSSAALGQTSSASITGVVKDVSGAVVPRAVIVLRSSATSVERQTLTNESGNYAFLNVLPGPYTLSAEGSGFSRSQTGPITLEVNQSATFDFVLNVGGVEQTVNVNAVGVNVEFTTAGLGAVVTQRQIADLPLNGRNFTQMLALAPGASPISTGQNKTGTTGGLRSLLNPSIGGQTNRSNLFLLDGMINSTSTSNFDNGGFNSYSIPPIIDTLLEFKVQSHNDEAQYGQVMGGIVNTVTKSGTNDLHGTAWEYVRNNDFDARSRFLPTVPPFRWNQFGAAAGGPVYVPKLYNGRNRTFFFVAYEGDRLRQPGTTLYRVPTSANFNGDFSDGNRAIFDPFSTRPDPNKPGQFLRDPFPNMTIPVARFDRTTLFYAKTILPAPTITGVPNTNAIDSTPTRDTVDSYQGRVDHNFTSKDFVFFRWTGRINNQTSAGGLKGAVSTNYADAKTYIISFTHTFGPSAVGSVQYGRLWQPYTSITAFTDLPADFLTQAGFDPAFVGNYVLTGKPSIPGLYVPGYWTSGSQGQNGAVPLDNRQYKGDFSKIVGRHTFKMGMELDRFDHFNGNATAHVDFSNPQTGDPQNLGSTGNTLASFFLGVPDAMTQRNNISTLTGMQIFSVYFQDQWKATDKLTVNLGLRYDKAYFPQFGDPAHNNEFVGTMDFNNGTYIVQKVPGSCAQLGKAPCIPTPDGSLPAHVVQGTLMKNYAPKNFGPRAGLAYKLGPKTALRAGFGIFYDLWAGLLQNGQNVQGVWPDIGQQLLSNLNAPTAASPTPTVKVTNPLANAGNALWPTPTPFTAVQWFYDPNQKDPYSMQWNFGIQHQVNTTTLAEVTYMGMGARRVDIGTFYNTALTPGPGSPQSRSLYPYIIPTYWDRSWARSNYEGVSVSLRKTFSDGFALGVAYTRSKTIDMGCDGYFGTEYCSSQDPYHLSMDRSVAGFSIPNYLAVNWLWAVPIGKGQALTTHNSVLDYIIGNWQLDGISSMRSGQPYSVILAGDIANTGNQSNYMRPNLVGDPTPPHQNATTWLLGSAFQSPPAFTFGGLGRNTYRGDWFKGVDLSLFRRFPISERLTFEFRGDAFNVFNVTSYATPNNNLSNANFGQVTTLANQPRQLQLSGRLRF